MITDLNYVLGQDLGSMGFYGPPPLAEAFASSLSFETGVPLSGAGECGFPTTSQWQLAFASTPSPGARDLSLMRGFSIAPPITQMFCMREGSRKRMRFVPVHNKGTL